MVRPVQTLLLFLLGVAVGGFVVWQLIGSYYQSEPAEREKALWRRLAELQALMKVPPTFWVVWERYVREQPRLSTSRTPRSEETQGKHGMQKPEQPGEDPGPRRERD